MHWLMSGAVMSLFIAGYSTSLPIVILSFATAVAGCPLLMNAMVLGGVRIPQAIACWLPVVFLLILLSPAFLQAALNRHREKRRETHLSTTGTASTAT